MHFKGSQNALKQNIPFIIYTSQFVIRNQGLNYQTKCLDLHTPDTVGYPLKQWVLKLAQSEQNKWNFHSKKNLSWSLNVLMLILVWKFWSGNADIYIFHLTLKTFSTLIILTGVVPLTVDDGGLATSLTNTEHICGVVYSVTQTSMTFWSPNKNSKIILWLIYGSLS